MVEAPPELARRIRQAREATHLTQREVATRMGISAPTMHFWETGRQEPSLEKLQRLAAILDIPFEELVGGRSPAGAREIPIYYPGPTAGTHEGAQVAEPRETYRVAAEYAAGVDLVFVLEGDSMSPTFQPGDVVAIHRQPTSAIGEYVLARLGSGETTFKRFGGRTQQGFVLLAANPALDPTIDPHAEILGVYVWLHRRAPGT
jgi:transcriptional regulator with XRE-family HTH domain